MHNQALVEDIVRILEAYAEGLTARDIRTTVLSETGRRARRQEIEEALRSSPRLFVGLANGIWRLRAVIETEEIVTGEADDDTLRVERGEPVTPYFANLRHLHSFIAFDLETTGIHPNRDQIIQIAAVRVVDGQPQAAQTGDGSQLPAVFNEYINLAGEPLPYSLRVKLGLTEHPEWEDALARADSEKEVIRRFRLWTGDLPLVAHNAHFDHSFIKKAAEKIGWNIPLESIIDTLELACVARPELDSFKLEVLARTLGVSENLAGGQIVEEWAQKCGVDEFSWAGFHNAIVDVLVLAAVVPRLMDGLQQRLRAQPLLAAELTRLFPELATQLDATVTVTPAVETAVKSLVQNAPVLNSKAGYQSASFTPKTVRQRFEHMIDENALKHRTAQLIMVESVSQALADNRFMLVEAPTGTGKTFAYLVPSVLWARATGKSVTISTHTRLLQDQMYSDLKKLNETLGEPFQAQVLKGMNNYICLERTAAVYAQTDHDTLDVEERFTWFYILSWLTTTQDGLLDELNYWVKNRFPALSQLERTLRAEREECSPKRCAACTVCFHRRAYQRAREADLIITNHALLLSKDWEGVELSFDRVIIDEAHNLEDTATDAATIEVSRETVSYFINRLLDQRSGQGVLIRMRHQIRDEAGQKLISVALNKRRVLKALVDDFGKQLKRYIELHQVEVDPRYGAKLQLEANPAEANPVSWKPVETARRRLTKTMQEAASVVNQLLKWLEAHPLPAFNDETKNEIAFLSRQLFEEANCLEDLLRVGYDRLVRLHWVEVERAIPLDNETDEGEYSGPYRWAVKQAPVRVGPFLEENLYADKKTLILTSATLRTTQESEFGFILDRLGLGGRVQPQDAIALPPEIDYSRALFAVARYMRNEARPSEMQNFIDEVGKEFEWFFRLTGGNGLGLFTAKVRMREVFRNIESKLGEYNIAVGAQGETGSRPALLEELKQRPGSVLLGLKSFWEGVDVPGPNLRYIIMEKLPFPMLGEPVIRARAAELRENGGHEFVDYILPLMLIDFKQGFGRLIRDEGDIGAVLLLDKRVWNREYRRDLFAALPGYEHFGLPERAPKVPDNDTMLSRHKLYAEIFKHMQQAPEAWQINEGHLQALLEILPEELLTKLEELLRELTLPDILSQEQLSAAWDTVWKGIRQLFHFESWKVPEQESVVAALLTGRDALVVLPTGSGKSFTFQLPAILRDGTTLVFSPLKALMKDQVDKLLDRGLTIADRVDSSQTAEEQERVYQRMRDGSTRLVYIAPERVRDPKLVAALREAKNIVQVVVDEAHCVHMWGQSFRPDFLYISHLVDSIAESRGRRPPVAALTATATSRVRSSVVTRLNLKNHIEIASNPNRPELRFLVYNKKSPGFRLNSKRDKFRMLLRILRAGDRRDESTIVYVNTTREAERLARRLEAMALDVRHYHGKMDDQARKDVQDMFLDGQVNTIVATKAFGMGVDKPDIRYVVHFQVPGDIESYFQEAGRAGRDGKTSWAILLYHPGDLWIHEEYFIPKSLPDPNQLENVLDWLKRRFARQAGSVMYLDPHMMATVLDFDEDTQLGVHLHLLEELGYIVRGLDVTLKASARLLVPRAILIDKVRELVSAEHAAALERILDNQGVNEIERSEIRLVEGAQNHGVDPSLLDHLLYQLALQGHLIYRSFARGYTLSPGPKLNNDLHLDFGADEVRRVQKEMTASLEKMKRYGESTLARGGCLREEILEHLGSEKPETRDDECCNLCDINLDVPWSAEPLWDNISDPARYHDLKYTILKAVATNAELEDVRGRAPYGEKTLAYILLGNDYMTVKYIEDSDRKQARRRAVTANEHFGVLEGLSGEEKTVLACLDELRKEGFVKDVYREWDDGSYTYPVPTTQGRARLNEGRLFA